MLKIVMGLLEEGKVEERKGGERKGGGRREEREARNILQHPFDPTSERIIYLFIHCLYPSILSLPERGCGLGRAQT